MHATEDLLAAIAHAIGVPIGVAVGRLETVKIAGLPMELFTADMSSTRIRFASACAALTASYSDFSLHKHIHESCCSCTSP